MKFAKIVIQSFPLARTARTIWKIESLLVDMTITFVDYSFVCFVYERCIFVCYKIKVLCSSTVVVKAVIFCKLNLIRNIVYM